MSKGRHAKPTEVTVPIKKIALGAGLALGTATIPLTFAGTAQAADMAKWNCIASYESGNSDGLDDGVWNLPYGDADSTGGLQIQDRTWADFGGTAISQHAYQATKAQQIEIAEKILAAQGPGAWATAGQCGSVGSWSGTPSLPTGGGGAPAPAPVPAATGGTVDPITGATVPGPKAGSKADLAVKYAIQAITYQLPYVLGGNGPQDGGYDCSGLTSQSWKAAGVDFTQSARDSYTQETLPGIISGATYVTSTANLLPGDLVTYDGFAGGHVALYVGPIGPQGQDLIETNSRHSPGAVDWSFMDSRSGRGPEARTTMVRPAPFVSAAPTPTPDPTPPPVPTPTPPPPPVPTPPPSNGGGTYTVQVGDYLSKIAKDQLGNAYRWREIYALNKSVIGSDPDLILPGQVLKLPVTNSGHHHHWHHNK